MCCLFNRWQICLNPKPNTDDKEKHIFSPSVHVHDTWRAVKKVVTDIMKVDTENEEAHYHEEYDPITVEHIIEPQHKVIDSQKKNKQKELSSN